MSSSAYPVIWALKHAPVVDAEERAILMALADHGDADGCNCFPSVATMARVALVSPSTVKRKLRALKARGVIRPQVGPAPARWLAMPSYLRATVYELMIPYSWWSDAQREEINRMRADRGRPPLTPDLRPDLAPAPPKKARADKGRPAPQRRPKSAPPKDNESPAQKPDTSAPPVSQTRGGDPVDNSGPRVFKTGDPGS